MTALRAALEGVLKEVKDEPAGSKRKSSPSAREGERVKRRRATGPAEEEPAEEEAKGRRAAKQVAQGDAETAAWRSLAADPAANVVKKEEIKRELGANVGADESATETSFVDGMRAREWLPVATHILPVGTRIECDFTDYLYIGTVLRHAEDGWSMLVRFDADGEEVTLRPRAHKFRAVTGSTAKQPASPRRQREELQQPSGTEATAGMPAGESWHSLAADPAANVVKDEQARKIKREPGADSSAQFADHADASAAHSNPVVAANGGDDDETEDESGSEDESDDDDSDTSEHAENVFVVERLIAKRRVRSSLEYRVRWKDYRPEDDTWEPVSNLRSAQAMIDQFEKKSAKQAVPVAAAPTVEVVDLSSREEEAKEDMLTRNQKTAFVKAVQSFACLDRMDDILADANLLHLDGKGKRKLTNFAEKVLKKCRKKVNTASSKDTVRVFGVEISAAAMVQVSDAMAVLQRLKCLRERRAAHSREPPMATTWAAPSSMFYDSFHTLHDKLLACTPSRRALVPSRQLIGSRWKHSDDANLLLACHLHGWARFDKVRHLLHSQLAASSRGLLPVHPDYQPDEVLKKRAMALVDALQKFGAWRQKARGKPSAPKERRRAPTVALPSAPQLVVLVSSDEEGEAAGEQADSGPSPVITPTVDPAAAVAASESPPPGEEASANAAAKTHEDDRDSSEGDSPLPAGWERTTHVDGDSGEHYRYKNVHTGEIQEQRPVAPAATASAPWLKGRYAAAAGLMAAAGKIPKRSAAAAQRPTAARPAAAAVAPLTDYPDAVREIAQRIIENQRPRNVELTKQLEHEAKEREAAAKRRLVLLAQEQQEKRKQLAKTTSATGLRGTVKIWNVAGGYGFIQPEDGTADVFCHVSALSDGDYLSEGSSVGYDRVFEEEQVASGKGIRAESVTGGKVDAEKEQARIKKQEKKEQNRVKKQEKQEKQERERLAKTTSAQGLRGLVKMWCEERGFGFIRPQDNTADVFCHYKEISDGDCLAEGASVKYDRLFDGTEPAGKQVRAENVTGGCCKATNQEQEEEEQEEEQYEESNASGYSSPDEAITSPTYDSDEYHDSPTSPTYSPAYYPASPTYSPAYSPIEGPADYDDVSDDEFGAGDTEDAWEEQRHSDDDSDTSTAAGINEEQEQDEQEHQENTLQEIWNRLDRLEQHASEQDEQQQLEQQQQEQQEQQQQLRPVGASVSASDTLFVKVFDWTAASKPLKIEVSELCEMLTAEVKASTEWGIAGMIVENARWVGKGKYFICDISANAKTYEQASSIIVNALNDHVIYDRHDIVGSGCLQLRVDYWRGGMTRTKTKKGKKGRRKKRRKQTH